MSLETAPETTPATAPEAPATAPAPTEKKALKKMEELMKQLRDLSDEVESMEEHKECVVCVSKAMRYFRDRVRTRKTDEQKRAYQREYYARRKQAGKPLTEAGLGNKRGRKPARVLE